VLEKSEGNRGTDPVMGLGEVTTKKQKRQRRKMKAVLSENIRQRAEQSQRALEQRKEEERRFLEHMQSLGAEKDAVRLRDKQHKQSVVVASWDRERHLQLLMKQHMPTAPQRYAGEDPPETGRSQFKGFSVGYDGR